MNVSSMRPVDRESVYLPLGQGPPMGRKSRLGHRKVPSALFRGGSTMPAAKEAVLEQASTARERVGTLLSSGNLLDMAADLHGILRTQGFDGGLFVMLCISWYMFSAMSSNTGKTILTQFKYPVTLTFVQFALVAFYSFVWLWGRHVAAQVHHHGLSLDTVLGKYSRGGDLFARFGVYKPTRLMILDTTVMSLFQVSGHIFTSMAIARVPVSIVHTIKALSPLFTVAAYSLIFKVSYSMQIYKALLPLTVGVMLACSIDFSASAIGLLCALVSALIFVSQNIFSKKLLPQEGKHHITASDARPCKLNLLFYSTATATLLMVPIWAYSDVPSLWSGQYKETMHASVVMRHGQPVNVEPLTHVGLMNKFFVNGTMHFLQTYLAFSLLARTSPVTYSIASLVKRIAVIVIAIIWFHQSVAAIQKVGLALTFAGLWMYNQAKRDVDSSEQRRAAVVNREPEILPSVNPSVAPKSNLHSRRQFSSHMGEMYRIAHEARA